MRGIKLSKQNFSSVLERTLHGLLQKAVFHSGSWPRTVRIPNPCFLYPSVSSDLCAASVEYKSFSVRLISQEEKKPVLANSGSLGQEQIHSGAETLKTHTKRLVEPATGPASPKACGTVKLHMKQLQGFAAPLSRQPEISRV